MAKYEKYDDYKELQSIFVEKIPMHWNVEPLYALCGFKQGKAHEPFIDDDGEFICVNARFVSTQGKGNSIKLCSVNLTPAKLHDILMVMSDLPNGRALARAFYVEESKNNYAVNQRVCAITAKKVHAKFLYYQLNRSPYFLMFNDGSNQTHLSNDAYKKYPVLLPSTIEQQKIADFLDHETAQIDTLIEKQQTLIQLLKEKRQAVISHAVTPDENEKSAKLGYFIDLLSGYAFPSNGYKIEPEGNTALLRGINVGVGALKWDETVWWSRSNRDGLEAFELEEGDIVFGMDRPWISAGARVAEVTKLDLPCLLLQRVIRIRANKNTYQPFIKLCLASKEFKFSVEADLTGVSVPHISPDQVKSFPIRDIGYEQQKLITDDAFEKMKVLDLIEDSAEQAIQLMQERRTALISAAVTGKIDVRGWVAPESKTTLESL